MIYLKDSFVPREHQLQQSKILTRHRRALLVEKTGKGKTMSCVMSFAILKEHQKVSNMLVLTPLSAYQKQVWKSDIEKFTNLKVIDLEDLYHRVANFPGKLSKLLEYYHVIYGKHSHFKQAHYAEFISQIVQSGRVVTVCDEVHAFKNANSKLTMLAKLYLRNAFSLWALTATPLSKNLQDTYSICNFVRPWFFGSFVSFRDTYCRTTSKVIGRLPGGALKKAVEITGIRDEQFFKEKLATLPVIQGSSEIHPNFNFIDYDLSPEEKSRYRRIAKGIDMSPDLSVQDWIKQVMEGTEVDSHPIKDVTRYSSRFIYLQSAADGILTDDGTQDRLGSTKVTVLMNKLQEIVSKGESVLVYFDYYAALEVVKRSINNLKLKATVLESTGEHTLKEGELTEGKCKLKPHIILCTRASAESASYYFIKNVIFFQIPTVPSTFVQFVGRITRINTLYPDDLQVYIFRSSNIDLYKLQIVSIKSYQMELVSGEEKNIPPDYKVLANSDGIVERQKKLLLWNI